MTSQIFWLKPLLFLLIFIIASFSAHNVNAEKPSPTDPFSLVISGGISLGVYEAGLNWAIVETLRYENAKDRTRYRLDNVAGASAGAINSILAAMRFCEADDKNELGSVGNNLFKQTWNVGIDDLLPDDSEDYNTIDLHLGLDGKRQVKDSLLSRNGFKSIIAQMEFAAAQARYRDGCRVNLALMVTHTQPQDYLIPTTTSEQTIRVQRFVVPLVIDARKLNAQATHASLFFRNNLAYSEISPKGSAYLFLPETNNAILFDHVARAALASSAFPGAFGRIQMDYCIPGEIQSGTSIQSTACPDNYQLDRGYFSDGGAFDNVPLGVAVDLLEACNQPDGSQKCQALTPGQTLSKGSYIYMDPATRRKVYVKPDNSADDDGSMSLKAQFETIIPTLSTLQSQELNMAIAQKFYKQGSNQHRSLLLTSRFAPITGNFLGHFGAFFDKSFQTYDYAVGVYDGLINVASYQCLVENKIEQGLVTCPDKRFFELAQALLSASPIEGKPARCDSDEMICQIIGAIYQWEHGASLANSFFPPLIADTQEKAIYDAMKKVGDTDFKVFLDALAEKSALFQGKQLQYMIENRGGFWKVDLLGRFAKRLVEMEEGAEGDLTAPLKMLAVMANSRKRSRKSSIWSLSSVPHKPWWYRMIPDQISMDGAQTGAALSWMGVPRFTAFSRWHIELDGTAHFQLKDVDSSRTHYASVGAALRYSVSSILGSSIGIGLNVNRNMTNTNLFGERYLTGGEITFGFLADKTRITIGTRDLLHDYIGEDWSVRIGITDLDSLLYVMGL